MKIAVSQNCLILFALSFDLFIIVLSPSANHSSPSYFRSDKREECANVLCAVEKHRQCPEDSVLIEGFVPEGQCCPTPSRCQCRPQNCAYTFCPSRHRRVLLSPATNSPGFCCDIYRCIPQNDNEKVNCATVQCNVPPLNSISCPSDSTPIHNPSTSSACCPGEPMCHCPKNNCPSPPSCKDGLKLHVAYRGNEQPGSCCDNYICSRGKVFTGCSVNGTRYEHGETYPLAKCMYCECTMGLSHCSNIQCNPIPPTCSGLIKDEGACCPRCLSNSPSPLYPNPPCQDGSKSYAFGETWSPDPCTHCTCAVNGLANCKAEFCQEPSTVAEVPRCPSLSNCTLNDGDCRYGFKYDLNQCRLCQCKKSILGCLPLASCQITCPLGYVVDESGCDTCQCRQKKCKELPSTCQKQCPYGFKPNKKNCERCKCRSCPAMNTCAKKCSLGLAQNKYGCSICKCKAVSSATPSYSPEISHMCSDPFKSTRHDDGETWSVDGCFVCLCRGGAVMCDTLQCPVPQCEKPVLEKGQCCSSCKGSQAQAPRLLSCRDADGGRYLEGEVWEYTKCNSCTCHKGHVMCTSTSCPPVTCKNSVYDENLCCPKCLDAPIHNLEAKSCRLDNGSLLENGREYRTSRCSSCVCRNGSIKCFTESCPAITACKYPVVKRGSCCPKCLGKSPSLHSCVTSKGVRLHAEKWNMTLNGCTACMCVNGTAECKEPICSPIPSNCRRAYQRPGECCRVCVRVGNGTAPITEPPATSSSSNVAIIIGVVLAIIFIGLALALGWYFIKRNPKWLKRYTPGTIETTTSLSVRAGNLEDGIECKDGSGSLGAGSSSTARSDMTNLSSSS